MATAKQAQSSRTESARGRKAQASEKKSLRQLYARLEKTRPGTAESKRISAQIVDAIG